MYWNEHLTIYNAQTNEFIGIVPSKERLSHSNSVGQKNKRHIMLPWTYGVMQGKLEFMSIKAVT